MEVQARFDTSKLLRNLDAIDRATARASMWTVREAGRKTKQFARSGAPVYKGPGLTRKQLAAGPLVSNPNRPVKGLYKASIHSSKQLKKVRPGEYANRVAPRGLRVSKYSRKVERQYHVMAAAEQRVTPLVRGIASKAWANAMKKRSN